MENFITNLFSNPAVPLAAVIGTCAAWALTGVARQWRKARLAELEAGLKRQMLDKNMSSEEIERVLRASKDQGVEASYAFTGQEVGDKAILVKMLSDYSYSGEDIECVLRAYDHAPSGADPAAARLGRAKAVQGMVENEQSAEDIARMLRAFHGVDGELRRDQFQELRR